VVHHIDIPACCWRPWQRPPEPRLPSDLVLTSPLSCGTNFTRVAKRTLFQLVSGTRRNVRGRLISFLPFLISRGTHSICDQTLSVISRKGHAAAPANRCGETRCASSWPLTDVSRPLIAVWFQAGPPMKSTAYRDAPFFCGPFRGPLPNFASRWGQHAQISLSHHRYLTRSHTAEAQELRLIDRRQDCPHCSPCPLWQRCRAAAACIFDPRPLIDA
jgi:hypothetical protein